MSVNGSGGCLAAPLRNLCVPCVSAAELFSRKGFPRQDVALFWDAPWNEIVLSRGRDSYNCPSDNCPSD